MKSAAFECLNSLILGTASVAVLMPDEETRILCFCIIAAAIGGFIGVERFSSALTPREKIWRWLSNFGSGILGGPLLTEWMSSKFEGFKISYLALICGGLSAALGVILLGIATPALAKWITAILKSPPRLP